MDIRKYQFNIFCLLLFPLSATGQEWNKQDSLRLQQMLESDQEIKINRKFIEKVEQNMYSRKPFVDFDPTLPTLKSSMIFSKPSIRTYQTFLKPGSTFLPTYSWLRINKNLVLHSKSNFAENSSCFHIQSQIEYNLSPKWSLNIYGVQNLDTRKHRGLPSEVEDHVPYYFTHGKTGDSFHNPAGIWKRHGKLSRTSLPGTDHSVHQVHLHELQVYRGSQYSCHHHDDLRCGDPVNEPDELKEP